MTKEDNQKENQKESNSKIGDKDKSSKNIECDEANSEASKVPITVDPEVGSLKKKHLERNHDWF